MRQPENGSHTQRMVEKKDRKHNPRDSMETPSALVSESSEKGPLDSQRDPIPYTKRANKKKTDKCQQECGATRMHTGESAVSTENDVAMSPKAK